MKTILIIDDDGGIRQALKKILEADGYAVKSADSAEAGDEELRRARPDLVLLDVRLPGKDGFAFCRKLRETPGWKSLPVIFLTSKAQEAHKVLGFELGGDDYVTKPFSALELLSRVKAVLRRHAPDPSEGDLLADGPVRLDVPGASLQVNGKPVKVTAKEFKLLALLMEKKGKVLSRPYLMESVWGRDYEKSTHTIDQHVYRLRKALGAAGEKILSLGSMGYKWTDE